MSKQIEALKMAIKALKNISKSLTEKQVWFSSDVYDAIQACKEALEQPTQEPMAYYKEWEDKSGKHKDIKFEQTEGYSPLYTHPKEWQGLSDEKLLKLLKSIDQSTERLPMGFKLFARAIEAELKEKNNASS